MAIGHTKNAAGVRQDLAVHLRAVAGLTAEFAAPLGAEAVGHYVGLWHDVGKFHPRFQRYLELAEVGGASRDDRVDHKAAGAQLASEHLGWPFSLVIAGHHGGLPSRVGLKAWLAQRSDTGEPSAAIGIARAEMTELEPKGRVSLPARLESARREIDVELFLRLLFSALVDADSLDTERHANPDLAGLRGSTARLEDLWPLLESSERTLLEQARDDEVSRQRRRVYEACVRAAESNPPGVFKLTVPTGGGKTRSGLAFAMRHAIRNGQRRIIVAVPFLTITDQTADVYRSIFNPSGSTELVLEDHSGARVDADDEGLDPSAVRARLAAENWDAPIVVTTTVQLFESLFANRRTPCRKLHGLANSVIILDEAQALPGPLLRPILDVLRDLSVNYNTSVVLSTATQPAFDEIGEFAEVPAVEVVADMPEVFAALRRVTYEWDVATPRSWSDIAAQLRDERQVLVIVNTKQDALTLVNELGNADTLHLSTSLCGAHRRAVLAEVRRRLSINEACRLVSTQVVEGGVDIDFPVVFRALAPLGGIIQAAGRCNREGWRATGRVVVFDPLDGGMPRTSDYRIGTDQTRGIIRDYGGSQIDANDPAVATAFFRAVYQLIDPDAKKIQAARASLDYPEVAGRFRMIDEDSASVVVPYALDVDPGPWHLASRLPDHRENARHIMRALRPYLVEIRLREFDRYVAQGLIEPLIPGVGRWLGVYDEVRGLSDAGPMGDSLVV